MTDFLTKCYYLTKSYHVEIFRQYNVDPVNIFCILHGSQFSLLIVISTGFYSDKDIKMGNTIIRAVLKKMKTLGFVFRSSSISGSKH